MLQIAVTLNNVQTEQLSDIMVAVNKIVPEMTGDQYIQNIVSGWFENRAKEEYIGHVRGTSLEQLKTEMGSLKDIRS